MRVWFVCSALQTAASGAGELASRQRVSVRQARWDGARALAEQPKGQPGRGAAHAGTAMQNSRMGVFPPQGGDNAPSWRMGGGCPQSPPGPETHECWAQSKPIACFPGQSYMKAGTAGWGDDAEGGKGELLEVPWPQVTASKLRPADLHTFSAGGRGSHQGHKRQ